MLAYLKAPLFFAGVGFLCWGLGQIYSPLLPISIGLFALYSSYVIAKG